jgi:hypothetical protein
MVAGKFDLRACSCQHLGAEESKFSVAKDDRAIPGRHGNLLQNLECSGEGLDKNSGFVGDAIGNHVQVALRQSHVLGKGAVPSNETEDSPAFAVTGESGTAAGALPAADVDLSADPPADESPVRRVHDFADELVAEDSLESLVAMDDLQVSVADAGQAKTDKRFAVGRRYRYLGDAKSITEDDRDQLTTRTLVPIGVQVQR